MDNVVDKIIELLRAALGTEFKKYFHGENKIPEQAIFPLIEVIGNTSSHFNIGTGGMMRKEHDIQINIKNTLKNFLKTNTNTEIISHKQWMEQKMEGDDVHGKFLPGTVMYVLHNDLQLDGLVNIHGEWEIDYVGEAYGEDYIITASVKFKTKRVVSCI